MRRLPYAMAAVVIAAAAGGYAYWGHGAADGDAGYVTETLSHGSVVATVTATGTVNPVTTVQVGTYVSGPIIAIDVDFNSRVHKGQRVAKIDPASFQVQVQSADANLANARAKVLKSQADLDMKQLTFERNTKLREKDLIAQSDVDTAKSDYDQAVAQLALDRASVQQAQAALDSARINLNYTDILSPVDGVVVSRSVDVGQTVAASFQTPTLFLIAQDLTKMQVDASVSESDIGGVSTGESAEFTVDAFPGRPFHGTVVQVRNAPVTVQNVVTYDVVIAVDNSDLALKPGMTATVTITTDRRDDVLRVPLRALSFSPPARDGHDAHAIARTPGADHAKRSSVWRVGADGELERVEVHTGLRDEQYAEVVGDSLNVGDTVATGLHGGAAKKDGVHLPGQMRFR
jgi:HlyD family secretion protein